MQKRVAQKRIGSALKLAVPCRNAPDHRSPLGARQRARAEVPSADRFELYYPPSDVLDPPDEKPYAEPTARFTPPSVKPAQVAKFDPPTPVFVPLDDDNAPPAYEIPEDDDDFVNPALIEFDDEPVREPKAHGKNKNRRDEQPQTAT